MMTSYSIHLAKSTLQENAERRASTHELKGLCKRCEVVSSAAYGLWASSFWCAVMQELTSGPKEGVQGVVSPHAKGIVPIPKKCTVTECRGRVDRKNTTGILERYREWSLVTVWCPLAESYLPKTRSYLPKTRPDCLLNAWSTVCLSNDYAN